MKIAKAAKSQIPLPDGSDTILQLSFTKLIVVDMNRYDMLYFSRLILWWIVPKADNVSLNAALKVDLQPMKINQEFILTYIKTQHC